MPPVAPQPLAFDFCSGQDLRLTMRLVKPGRRELIPNVDFFLLIFLLCNFF